MSDKVKPFFIFFWIAGKSEFVEVSPSGRRGKRALPGGSSLFWKSEPKSTRGFGPWTPFY